MKIHPLHDRVVIKRSDEESTSPGGIVIPDTAKDKPVFGVIVAAGAGKPLENGQVRSLLVKKGDKVLFGKYAGTEVSFEGEDYLIMRESDILAVI